MASVVKERLIKAIQFILGTLLSVLAGDQARRHDAVLDALPIFFVGIFISSLYEEWQEKPERSPGYLLPIFKLSVIFLALNNTLGWIDWSSNFQSFLPFIAACVLEVLAMLVAGRQIVQYRQTPRENRVRLNLFPLPFNIGAAKTDLKGFVQEEDLVAKRRGQRVRWVVFFSTHHVVGIILILTIIGTVIVAYFSK